MEDGVASTPNTTPTIPMAKALVKPKKELTPKLHTLETRKHAGRSDKLKERLAEAILVGKCSSVAWQN
jgi:hypothetical protein